MAHCENTFRKFCWIGIKIECRIHMQDFGTIHKVIATYVVVELVGGYVCSYRKHSATTNK